MAPLEEKGALVKPIQSYVIRIYRSEADALAGVIEDVRTSRTAAFQSHLDLWQVLSGQRRLLRRQARIPLAAEEPGEP
jgi:hypothetical protein